MRALLIGLALLALSAPGFAHAQSSALSPADVDAALQRSLGYDPSTRWQVLDIQPSEIAGLTEVTVAINGGAPTKLYVSSDAQIAVAGEAIPFGPDPFAQARARLAAADGPSRGGGAITLVVFNDFECAHCKAAQPVLNQLASDFPQVRQVFVEFPLPASLHPWAETAARIGDCVARMNPKGFWSFTDAAFAAQSDITKETAESSLLALAAEAGLDRAAVSACASSPETVARVNASLALAKSLRVTEVPTVFLNGRRVLGLSAIPYDKLKQMVAFEIDHANR